jgi:hypothetical protein
MAWRDPDQGSSSLPEAYSNLKSRSRLEDPIETKIPDKLALQEESIAWLFKYVATFFCFISVLLTFYGLRSVTIEQSGKPPTEILTGVNRGPKVSEPFSQYSATLNFSQDLKRGPRVGKIFNSSS